MILPSEKLNEMKNHDDEEKPHVSDVKRAGGIPMHTDGNGNHFVCLFTSNDDAFGGPKPQISKGRVDEGESVREAAAREVHEETGLPLEDLKAGQFMLSDMDFSGNKENYSIVFFGFWLPEMKDAFETKEGHGQWYSISEARKVIREDHLPILNKAISYIFGGHYVSNHV